MRITEIPLIMVEQQDRFRENKLVHKSNILKTNKKQFLQD